MRSGMPMLSVRLPASTIEALDDLAGERGIDRSRLVCQLLDAGLRGRPRPSSEPVTENELEALLIEKARAGNTAAIRTLLARCVGLNPGEEAWRTLEAMVRGARVVTALLRAAFAALGHDGDGLERVAGALRASGDAETLCCSMATSTPMTSAISRCWTLPSRCRSRMVSSRLTCSRRSVHPVRIAGRGSAAMVGEVPYSSAAAAVAFPDAARLSADEHRPTEQASGSERMCDGIVQAA